MYFWLEPRHASAGYLVAFLSIFLNLQPDICAMIMQQQLCWEQQAGLMVMPQPMKAKLYPSMQAQYVVALTQRRLGQCRTHLQAA